MGIVTKSMMGAFVAANTIAAAGSFQAASEMHRSPFVNSDEQNQMIWRRPTDNLSRLILGDHGESYTMQYNMVGYEDEHIDARFTRALGNIFNFSDAQTPEDRNLGMKMFGLTSMAATTPGSYAGGWFADLTANIADNM